LRHLSKSRLIYKIVVNLQHLFLKFDVMIAD